MVQVGADPRLVGVCEGCLALVISADFGHRREQRGAGMSWSASIHWSSGPSLDVTFHTPSAPCSMVIQLFRP